MAVPQDTTQRTANKGMTKRRADVQTWSFCASFKFIAGGKFCAPKPAQTALLFCWLVHFEKKYGV